MKKILDKIFIRSNNLDFISKKIQNLTNNTPSKKIFEAINNFSAYSEIRYVGGCIRKIINEEAVDDIDMATNLEPAEIIEALKINNINFYETGISHGTITAQINEYKFEITSLRKDISTDGRHAKVRFSKNWKEDASRRDFTINSIYSDKDGNLFDPYNGLKDLEEGYINFIGDAEKRIKEDYLRILRYFRFFLNYSKHPHNSEVIKKLKMNISGVSNLSKERLLDELKKIMKLETIEKLLGDKLSLEIMLTIFPELKNINIFSKLSTNKKEILKREDFIFLLSLMLVDGTDNVDYFFYKFSLSKKDQKRIKIISNFFKEKIDKKTFDEINMNKLFYFNGRQAVTDILNFKIIISKKVDMRLIEMSEIYSNKKITSMPITAKMLMTKYNIPEGKQLGEKLKIIEQEWVNNNFKISDQQIDRIIHS